jgi:hypothetical protein
VDGALNLLPLYAFVARTRIILLSHTHLVLKDSLSQCCWVSDSVGRGFTFSYAVPEHGRTKAMRSCDSAEPNELILTFLVMHSPFGVA